jgi:cellulose synthase operon protein C
MKTMKTLNSVRIQILIAAVAASVVSAPMSAEAKKDKEQGVEEQLKFKAGDESGNEVKALKTEMLVIKSEKQAVAQLEKLLKRYKKTRMEPEILFRFAELYMRRARSERFFEIHKNDKEIVSFVPQLVKDASESNEIKKAIGYYLEIQEKWPRFRSMDVVMFNNAYAYQQLGDDKKAESLLYRMIKEHGSSGLVPDAYLAVGEIAFQRRDFKLALEQFKAIRRFPNARVYPYGIYKTAWTYYNLQDANSGLKELEDVVSFGHQVALSKMDSKLDLRKEALGDMALFFSDVRKSDDAVKYFQAQAKELDAIPFIMRLVELYNRHSQYKDIESVLKDVLKTWPEAPSAAQAHEELAWNYERLKNRAAAGDQLLAFDKWCDALVERTPAPKKGQPAVEPECRTKITEASKKLSTKWHALWKKQGGPDDLAASSEKTYRLYLKHATLKDSELPAVRFSFSELLFARSNFREASDSYAMLDKYANDGAKIDAKVGHDAAYGAIVALEKSNGDKWSDDDEKKFQGLSDVYVKRFPQGQYAFDLRFKRAFIAYEKERYDESAPQFKKIGWADVASASQASDKILKAQDLYLDILNIKKDYKGIKEAAKLLLGGKADATRTTQIEKIYREAYFSEIQQMEEKGEIAQAVEAYKKFALENTGSELAPKAWWNASQLQFRMGDAQGGANTCYQMHKLFPKSTNGRDCLTKAAQTFETMARLDLAARVLLNLALVEADKQDKWREVAADFFALSGDKERAITMYQKLAEERKKQSEQVALLDKAAILARDTGDMKTLAALEAKFTRDGIEPQASRLVVEQAEEALAKQDYTKAFNVSKRIIGKSSLPKDLLARARFVQAQVLEDEYRRQSVKARVEKVGMVLAMKTEKLEKAQKAFQSAINYGDPATSVKSLKRLANCYLDYAKQVREMELKGVSDADLQAFRSETEQLVVPMEEKGIESMNQALDAAKKAQLREGQIAEIQMEVNKLNMKAEVLPTVTVSQPVAYVPKVGSISKTEVGL